MSTVTEETQRRRDSSSGNASAPRAAELRSVDRELLLALRGGQSMGVGELTDLLGVTATAVRQRVERLLTTGLIEREKVVAGRGRPTYRYRLTVAGHQRAGADPSDLVDAMWREILALPDADTRERLLSAVAARLGRQFHEQLRQLFSETEASRGNDSATLDDRVRRLSEILTDRSVETDVSNAGDLPVLDVGSCPFPSLTEASEDRAMCRLEEKMFSEALGRPVHLSSCRLDGDSCCQFTPVEDADE
jgi:predicted ArsR family transcriptional regulator